MQRWIIRIVLLLALAGCGGSAIDVSKVDPETILREGDLPAGYTWTTGDSDTSKIDPKPDKFAARSVEAGDAVSGNVSLVIYADKAQATAFYDKASGGEPLTIGDRGVVETKETDDIKQVTYSFQRCGVVVRASFLNVMVALPNDRDITSMLRSIDERLQNGPACGR